MQRIKIILLLCFSFSFFASRAQESMLTDISYKYLDLLVATAKANYPRMKTYGQRINIAEINIKKARLSWFDVFSFSYLYSPTNTTTLINPSFLNGYQVGMYVNIGAALQKPSAVKVAKSEMEIARFEKEEYELNIEAMVKQRYYLYMQSLAMLKLKASSATDAESSMKQIKYRFEKGEETFQNFNNTSMTYTGHLQAKIEAESSFLIAKSNLEELLGKKLEEIK